MDADRPRVPALCPDFLIETYLDHQGEQFCLKYDANSLIYISKAMDLFDMTDEALEELRLAPASAPTPPADDALYSTRSHPPPHAPAPHLPALAKGLNPCDTRRPLFWEFSQTYCSQSTSSARSLMLCVWLVTRAYVTTSSVVCGATIRSYLTSPESVGRFVVSSRSCPRLA